MQSEEPMPRAPAISRQLSPEAFLANTLRLFPGGTLIVLVTPDPKGSGFLTHARGMVDTDATQALEILAAAQVCLERQTAQVVHAIHHAVNEGKPQEEHASVEDIVASFDSMVEEQREQTDADVEAAIQERKRKLEPEYCECGEASKPVEAIVRGRTMKVCGRCYKQTR